MTNTADPFDFADPGLTRQGLTRQTYLDILAAGGETGWWDEHGIPAPWPEDFCDPDSGWQPTTGGDTTNTDPSNPTKTKDQPLHHVQGLDLDLV